MANWKTIQTFNSLNKPFLFGQDLLKSTWTFDNPFRLVCKIRKSRYSRSYLVYSFLFYLAERDYRSLARVIMSFQYRKKNLFLTNYSINWNKQRWLMILSERFSAKTEAKSLFAMFRLASGPVGRSCRYITFLLCLPDKKNSKDM